MHRVLNETTMKKLSQMHAEHEGLALLVLDPKEEKVDGVWQELKGRLYAVADRDGLDELCEADRKLSVLHVSTMLDTAPLDDGMARFGIISI